MTEEECAVSCEAPPPPDLYKCIHGSCVLSTDGTGELRDSCDATCVPDITPMYRCDSGSCIRDDLHGTLTESECMSSCTLPPIKYSCYLGSCVRDSNGSFTESTCADSCELPPQTFKPVNIYMHLRWWYNGHIGKQVPGDEANWWKYENRKVRFGTAYMESSSGIFAYLDRHTVWDSDPYDLEVSLSKVGDSEDWKKWTDVVTWVDGYNRLPFWTVDLDPDQRYVLKVRHNDKITAAQPVFTSNDYREYMDENGEFLAKTVLKSTGRSPVYRFDLVEDEPLNPPEPEPACYHKIMMRDSITKSPLVGVEGEETHRVTAIVNKRYKPGEVPDEFVLLMEDPDDPLTGEAGWYCADGVFPEGKSLILAGEVLEGSSRDPKYSKQEKSPVVFNSGIANSVYVDLVKDMTPNEATQSLGVEYMLRISLVRKPPEIRMTKRGAPGETYYMKCEQDPAWGVVLDSNGELAENDKEALLEYYDEGRYCKMYKNSDLTGSYRAIDGCIVAPVPEICYNTDLELIQTGAGAADSSYEIVCTSGTYTLDTDSTGLLQGLAGITDGNTCYIEGTVVGSCDAGTELVLPDLCSNGTSFEQTGLAPEGDYIFTIRGDDGTYLSLSSTQGLFTNLANNTSLAAYCKDNPYSCNLEVESHGSVIDSTTVGSCSSGSRYDCINGTCTPSTTGVYPTEDACKQSGCEVPVVNGVKTFRVKKGSVNPIV